MRTRMILPALFFPALLLGRIIHIPGDGDSIQEGIDQSRAQDTVLVAPGRYEENIDFGGRAITVGSQVLTTGDPAWADSTVLDGVENGRSLVIIHGVDAGTAVLSGLTIQNAVTPYGAGMNIQGSAATVEYCIIRHNTATEVGGGIFVDGGDLIVDHCMLDSNETDHGPGGGIHSTNSALTIVNSTFVYNSTDVGGGGGLYMDQVEGYVICCTFSENLADGNGGGIYCQDGALLRLWNTIMWNDVPQEVWVVNVGGVTVSFTDMSRGRAGIETGHNDYVDWLGGNINQNPRFVDPGAHNFRLTERSPCIDAGDPDYLPDPDLTRADIGANYFHQHPAIAVEPARLDFPIVRPGLNWRMMLNIVNGGGEILAVSSQQILPEDTPFVLDIGGGAFDLEPDQNHISWLLFFPRAEGMYHAVLRLESNDPDQSAFDVPLSGATM